MRRPRDAREIAERGIDVDELDDRRGTLAAAPARRHDDQRGPRRLLVVRVLAPHPVVAEVPAVVAPEDDDRVVGEPEGVEFLEQPADLGVHETRRRVVAVHERALERLRQVAAFGDTSVVAEFVAELRGERRRGLRRHAGISQRQRGWIMEVPVAGRRTKRQVRLEKPRGQEEPLARLFEAAEPLDRSCRDSAIRIRFVGHVGPFEGGPLFEAVRVARSVGEERLLPRGRRAGLRQDVFDRLLLHMRHAPRDRILAVAVADVKDLAQAVAGVAVLLEPLRQCLHSWCAEAEVGTEVVDAKRLRSQAGEHCVAGGRADGLHAVGPLEHGAPGCQPIDGRRFGMRVAVAAKRGLEVIDRDKEHVLLGGAGGRQQADNHRGHTGEHPKRPS